MAKWGPHAGYTKSSLASHQSCRPETAFGHQSINCEKTQSSLIVALAGTADVSETLRAIVSRGECTACLGLDILRCRGLAARIRTRGQEPSTEEARRDHRPALSTKYDPSSASDITRLIASILVAIAMEPVRA